MNIKKSHESSISIDNAAYIPAISLGFTFRAVTTTGLSWELVSQYLNNLRRIDYATRQGHEWTITDKGRQYYSTFIVQFNKIHRGRSAGGDFIGIPNSI